MITATIEGAAPAELRRLAEGLIRSGACVCEISPTEVLQRLCERRGVGLLAMMPTEAVVSAKARHITRVGEAAERGEQPAVLRALRAWAYTYIEELWRQARDGAWGTVEGATARRKRRAAAPNAETYGVRTRGAEAWYSWLKQQVREKVGSMNGP